MEETQIGGGRSTAVVVKVKTVTGEKKVFVTGTHPPLKLDPYVLRNQVVKPSEYSKKSAKSWWKDPEMKRRRRVAKYKFYAAEGKMKHSLKKGFRWIKNKCERFISGF